jgi:3-oxoacyl-[acyl-carrier protein] reductase
MTKSSSRTVAITGAASGIGLGIAKRFYTSGYNVSLCDFRADSLDQATSLFSDRSRVHFQTVDVRDQASVQDFIEATERALGPLTVAVANAGIYPNTPILDMVQDEWDEVMETNARGTFLICQSAAGRMVSNGNGGKIITISSGAAFSGRKGAAHYCASKAAIVMLTKVLALELAEHNINVNCIAPGLIKVDSEVSPISGEYFTTLAQSIPLGRAGQPDDIAKAAVFLASPDADFITGTVIQVDGGSSAGRAFLPLSNPPDDTIDSGS